VSDKEKGFWQTAPGVFSAIAAIVTAMTGLLVAADQLDIFGREPEATAVPTEVPSSPAVIVLQQTATPTPTSVAPTPTPVPPTSTPVPPTPTPGTTIAETPTTIPSPAERMIESFESYSDDGALRAAYSTDAPENDASVSLSVARNVYAGNQSLAFAYDIHTVVPIGEDIATDYAGLIRDFAIQDWRGFNYLRLWVRSDGSTKDLVIQFHEASGEVWRHTTNLSNFGEKDLELALDMSDFEPADWSPWVNGEIDLGSVAGFSIYVGHAGPGRGTIYIDAIRLSE
jgi:hypothetical protein